jgi:hypothetical protein
MQASLSYPSGVAVDGSGSIYIGDTNNKRIRGVVSSGVTPQIFTFGGARVEKAIASNDRK